MPHRKQPRTLDQVKMSLAVHEERIKKQLPTLTKLYPEFPMDLLFSVEDNFRSFLDYLLTLEKIYKDYKVKS